MPTPKTSASAEAEGLDVERPYVTSEDMWEAWIESEPQSGDGRHMIRLAEAVNRRIHVAARLANEEGEA